MVRPAFHANFHAGKAHRPDPFSLVLAKSQSDRDFHLRFLDQPLLQGPPTTSNIEDARSTIGARLLNMVLEFALLSGFERVSLFVVHSARVTTFAIEK